MGRTFLSSPGSIAEPVLSWVSNGRVEASCRKVTTRGGMTMRFRAVFAVLATSVMLSSGPVNGEVMVSGTLLGSNAPQQPRILVVKPVPGGITGKPLRKHVPFWCGTASCTCVGAADCFDLGSKKLCDMSTFHCT